MRNNQQAGCIVYRETIIYFLPLRKDFSIRRLVNCHMTKVEIHFRSLLLLFFKQWCLVSILWTRKLTWLGCFYSPSISSNPFFIVVPLSILLVNKIICAYSCHFFFYQLYEYIKWFYMSKWAHFVFPFIYLFIYSASEYQRYTKANIGPWWVDNRQIILSTSKEPRRLLVLSSIYIERSILLPQQS